MKKVFFFAAVLLCSVSLMAEKTVVKFNTTEAISVSEKVYDGTTIAQTTGGAFEIIGDVLTGDEVSVQLDSARFDVPNAGASHKVYFYFGLTGKDAAKYALEPGYEKDSVSNGRISSKELVVDTTGWDIAIEKMFAESDASAQVITPATIDENEVIDGDDVALVTFARYKDAAVGINKTITAIFSLVGADAANYKLGTTSCVYSNEGIIAAWIILTPFEDGSYFHTTDIAGVCPDEIEYAAYQLEKGDVTVFSIYYGEAAKNAGFEDVELALSDVANNIKIDVPAGAPCGSYFAEVVLTYQGQDDAVYSTGRLPFNFIVKVASEDIVALYSDVVAIRDLDNRYAAYQWYKDGAIIEGATKAYYQQEGGLSGAYSLKVATTEGENYLSCEQSFTKAKTTPATAKFVAGDQVVVIVGGSGYNILGENVY